MVDFKSSNIFKINQIVFKNPVRNMKMILITIILLLWATICINAQNNEKGIRFHVGNTLKSTIMVLDRGDKAVLTTEINALNSGVSKFNFGLSYDIWKRKNTFVSIGCDYSFMGNNLRNGNINNNTYTYRVAISSIAIPIETRYYVYSKKESKLSIFLVGVIVPTILVDGKLSRKENIFDNNQKYESTVENNVSNVKFYPVNMNVNAGFGIEYKPSNRKMSVWVSPQYNFQINPTWSEGIKQNINFWGVTIGTHLPIN